MKYTIFGESHGPAIGVTLTPGLAAYLPVMIATGIFTGAFTGLCAQFLTERLKY